MEDRTIRIGVDVGGTNTDIRAITGIGAIVMPSVVGWVAEGFGITAGMYAILIAVMVDVALIFANAVLCRGRKA